MTKGLLADIKRLEIHDGPGIRSTLFLQACSLHCLWCHNPESIPHEPFVLYTDQRCQDCGRCVTACPSGAQLLDAAGKHHFDRSLCRRCGRCVEACLLDVLRFSARWVGVDEAMALLLEDRDFYEQSGGGVTLSGGEPLCQAEFCAELLQRLRAAGIHTAVDTCGNVPWQAFARVLPHCSLFLYDLKLMDSEGHRALTGCGNELILANLRRLAGAGTPIEIRMPLVPTLTLSAAECHAAGKFLAGLPQSLTVRLLPYHSYARDKYRHAGMTDRMPQLPGATAEELEEAATMLRSYDLQVINSLRE
jgi:pyruvate formate lyase activating enzyme